MSEEFNITDDKTADWAVRKIAEEEAEYERIKTLACEQIDEITKKVETAKKRFENSTEYLRGKLAEYFRSVPHKVTKTTEKYALLSGTLTLKKAVKKLKHDAEKLTEWLAANGYTDFIKIEQSPRWGDFKKLLDCSGEVAMIAETGEVVEGVILEDAPEEFQVDIEKR